MSAQQTSSDIVPLNRYFSQTWSTQKGLPHNSINALAQTADGYIWVATWEGVARYNGVEFKLFTRGEETGLPDSGIRSLSYHSTTNELLVAGSRGGISSISGSQWTSHPPTRSMVNHAYKSHDDTLWLALEDAGIQVRFSDGTEAQFLTHVSGYRVIEDKFGKLWFATSQGLFSIDRNDLTLVSPPKAALSGPIFSLALDHNGYVLAGTEHGVWQHSEQGFSSLHAGLANESVSSILLDSHNNIWFGTINHGLYRLSPLGLEKLDASAGLPNNRIFSLLEDTENSIWVGTTGGLFRLRRAPFTTFTQSQGLSGDYIRTVMQGTDGTIFIGGSSGLDVFDHARFSSIESPLARPISVLSLANFSNNSVLVGTYTDGVLQYKNGKLSPYLNRAQGLPSNEVRAILHAKDGSVWFATAHGLARRKTDGSLTLYDETNGLPAHFTMGLAEDVQGRIWVATGLGAAYVKNDIIHNISFPQSSDAEYAFSFYGTEEGMWMATDRGVAFFDNQTKTISFVGKAQGMPVDKVFAITFDGNGRAWMSSNQGVILSTLDSLRAAMADPTVTLNFEQFKEEDGLVSMQMNGGSQPSVFHSGNDDLWFASAKGLATIQPTNLAKISEFPIPVVIEQVKLDGQSQSSNRLVETMKIPSDIGRVTFTYAGLGFAMPTRIEYQTMLEGYDSHWTDRHQMRVTEYTNLMPGAYSFKVRARYPGGTWQEANNPLKIEVEPHFTQTLGFKILVLVLICLTIFIVFRLRFHHLKKSELTLKQRVQEQTESLERQTKLFEYQATHDGLTGIANRRAFDDELVKFCVHAKAQSQPLSLAIIDIDHFKQVNDQHSHLIGDKVIAEVAQQINVMLPKEAMCARWGGEEFTVLLPNLDIKQGRDQIDAIRQAIKQHDFSHIADKLCISVSAGVASLNAAGDYKSLLKHADHALYIAKQQGRDKVISYS